eukprot:8421267-Alexandrium_andersonii.AAC.1
MTVVGNSLAAGAAAPRSSSSMGSGSSAGCLAGGLSCRARPSSPGSRSRTRPRGAGSGRPTRPSRWPRTHGRAGPGGGRSGRCCSRANPARASGG